MRDSDSEITEKGPNVLKVQKREGEGMKSSTSEMAINGLKPDPELKKKIPSGENSRIVNGLATLNESICKSCPVQNPVSENKKYK